MRPDEVGICEQRELKNSVNGKAKGTGERREHTYIGILNTGDPWEPDEHRKMIDRDTTKGQI